MTFEEINSNLPNGLHDAEIEVITQDFRAQTLTFRLLVWIGTMDEPSSQREQHRRGELRFESVEHFSVSPPRGSEGDLPRILTFDLSANLAEGWKASPPFDESTYRIFIGWWEMDVAAGSVNFAWIDTDEPIPNLAARSKHYRVGEIIE